MSDDNEKKNKKEGTMPSDNTTTPTNRSKKKQKSAEPSKPWIDWKLAGIIIALGDYEVVIDKVETGKTKNGSGVEKHDVMLRITKAHDEANAQFVGHVVYDTLVYSQRGAFKPKQFFAALEIDPPESPDALEGIALMAQGRACAVRVGHQERDTGTVAVVKKYLPVKA